jgi:polyisoprenoid-binding protein YceI
MTTKTIPPATAWAIDEGHTQIGFRVRHMMVSWTRGRFGSFRGTVTYDDARPEDARVEVEIDAASVDTKFAQRDEHLRSADFLDAANHPHLIFRSRTVTAAREGRLSILGELTIRGVTRPVTLEVEGITPGHRDPWGGVRRGATATATIDRKDFGLLWNGLLEGGGLLVGDAVTIELEVELVRQQVGQQAAA